MTVRITGTQIVMADATTGNSGVVSALSTIVGTANTVVSYIVLPGRRMIVMGQVFVPNRTSSNPTTVVTFPVAFSATPLAIVGPVYDQSTTGDVRPVKLDSISTTQMAVRSSADTLDFRCTFMVFGPTA